MPARTDSDVFVPIRITKPGNFNNDHGLRENRCGYFFSGDVSDGLVAGSTATDVRGRVCGTVLAVETIPAGTALPAGDDDTWGEPGEVQPAVKRSPANVERAKKSVREVSIGYLL